MNQNMNVLNKVEDAKLVAVVRGADAEEAIAITEAAISGGFQIIELTYTTPEITKVFEALSGTKAVIGAGSVLDSETARHAILNGAKFIVGPHFQAGIAELCNRYSVPYFPGCMTITEVVSAWESGSRIVKLFPANQFDPSFISAVKGPLPQVRLMPTGGVNLNNVNEWLEAGAAAVGIGSDLNRAYLNNGKKAVEALCEQYIEAIKE